MINILIVENGKTAGGSYRSVELICNNIDIRQYRVTVLFTNRFVYDIAIKNRNIKCIYAYDSLLSTYGAKKTNPILSRLQHYCIKCFPQWYYSFLKIISRNYISNIKRIIQALDIDIVHANNDPLLNGAALIAAHITGTHCVSHLRSVQQITMYDLRRILKKLMDHVNVFVANSEYCKRMWLGQGLKEENMRLVVNAVDASKFEKLQSSHLSGRKDVVVGCVSNLYKRKGFDYLINAFHDLRNMKQNCKLVIVGEGPYRREIERKIVELGLEQSVTLQGYSENVFSDIVNYDVLISPSQNETFGRVLIEAMSMKVPVIATNVGAIPEIVEHEKTGLLIEYGNNGEFVNAIIRLQNDNLLRENLITNAYFAVTEKYNEKKYIAAIETMYNSLGGEKDRRGKASVSASI